MSWQFILGPASGGHSEPLTAATSRKYTAKLIDPSEVSFGIDARHEQAAAIGELTTDIHVLWTPDSGGTTRELERCRVAGPQDTGNPDTHGLTISGLDYAAVLKGRQLLSSSTLTYTGVDQAQIAWSLIAETQARAGGDLGIAKGWASSTPTGLINTRTFAPGDNIGDKITELSQTVPGYDWAIVPTSASGLAMQLWYPQRGIARGAVLEYGGAVTDFSRSFDPSTYGNCLRYTGADGLTAVELEVPDMATRAEGRWERVFGDTTLLTQGALQDRAEWQLAQLLAAGPTYTLTLQRGVWEGPDQMWLGDPVQLLINSGRLAVNTSLRIYELAFDIDDDGGEAVQVTLGGPRPDYRKRPALVDQRLTTLERR